MKCKITKYDNGMNMNCYRYEYDEVQELLLDNGETIFYDMLEVEDDTDNFPFGIYFSYHFYYRNGIVVKTRIMN